jgi:GT2 family glycosyltransferase/lipopolysaccharide/colanic/teichoic acid biosynthesis glycosyltransferase
VDLSVIIVNYNVRQFLESALASIARAMEGVQGEVFVVDNASDDGSAEMVRTKFPDVRLIQNAENLGFASANNLALRRATGKFLLLINPDTIVQEDTLHVMLRFFTENPDVGLAGCKILNPGGTFQLACRRSFPTPWVAFTKIVGLSALFPSSRLFGRYNLTYLSPDETYEVDAVSGSFMMMRREAYERVGDLDESFFMYGEDLDWCYRVGEAGFKVYYVHSTKVVHFKGESTKRSAINEVKVFYQAMQLFVSKHFGRSRSLRFILSLGILLTGFLASLRRASRPLLLAFTDAMLVNLAISVSAWAYFGDLFKFPLNAHWVVWVIPAVIVVSALYYAGLYTTHRYSSSRAGIGVLVGYILLSAIVFFAKELAYSRAVVLISGFLSFMIIPGWRLMARLRASSGARTSGRKSLFGRRTLIVGTGPSGQEVLRKLRARVDDGYDVQGFIDLNRKRIGERIAGVEIVGSIENVGKVIMERKVGEVIFSTDSLPYTEMLSVIARCSTANVNFRLVPNSLEAIIGKTRIDELDTLPLVEIEYNIQKPGNRFVKRLFDLVVGAALLVSVYPVVRMRKAAGRTIAPRSVAERLLLLPRVVGGELSLVGRPLAEPEGTASHQLAGLDGKTGYLGPRGLTGLVQINEREDLGDEERERYKLYYAKNQSFILDMEIILKSLLRRRK